MFPGNCGSHFFEKISKVLENLFTLASLSATINISYINLVYGLLEENRITSTLNDITNRICLGKNISNKSYSY